MRDWVVCLLLLGIGTWNGVRGAPPGEILRVNQNIPGDSKPIVLHADHISTWVEGRQRIIVLKGMVLVEQGVVNGRMQGAVAVVDLDHQKQTGILRVRVYAEGDVHLESGPVNRQGLKAVLELNTRGELKLRSQFSKVVQQPAPGEPLYGRALAELGVKPSATLHTASGVQPQALPVSAQPNAGPPATPITPKPTGIVPATGNAVPSMPGLVPSPPALPTRPAVPSPALGAPAPPGKQTSSAYTPSGETLIVRAQAPDQPAPGGSPSGVASPGSGPFPAPGIPQPANPNAPGVPFPGGPGNVPPGSDPYRNPNYPSVPPPIMPPVPPPVANAPGSPIATPPVANAPGSPIATPPGANAPGSSTAPVPPRPAPAPATPAPRRFRLSPRNTATIEYKVEPLPNGEFAWVITGGAILTIEGGLNGPGIVDIEADLVVLWTRKGLNELARGLQSPEGHQSREGEFYLAGNVEIREKTKTDQRTLRADEVYYDVARDIAIARHAELQFKQPGLPDPIHFNADEIQKLSANEFKGYRAEIFSSRLPSDPGVKIYVQEGTYESTVIPKKSIFGRQYVNRQTGLPETETERLLHGTNVFLELESVPIFYVPFIQGDANDPLGPLQSVNFKYDKIFGFQAFTSFNVYDLIGMDPLVGTHWKFFADYLTARGPALGSDFDYTGKDLFGIPGKYEGLIRTYGIHDTGTDILGGIRGEFDNHPIWRGRFFWRHQQELPDDFSLQAQVSALSDKNFLEQYYKSEFDREYNQETFVYLKQQRGIWAWTALAEPRIREWVTETEHLPEVNGFLIGYNPFADLSYNARVSGGYYQLKPTNEPPPPINVTDAPDATGRFDIRQEVSYPFALGFLKLVPYGVLDFTYYTRDLTGSDRGRLYEGGGLRASMPLTRLYPGIQSELLNLNGIDHKINFTADYFYAHSDTSFFRLPQLDQLNDNATDQALRDIKPLEPIYNPAHGLEVMHSQLYDPQLYAVHQLIDNRIDTLDSVDVIQGDLLQRWQTKRGYPGQQHIIDWMTLDLSGAYYFNSKNDPIGRDFSYFQYYWNWNIGDRTALESTGWVEPSDPGVRVFTIGAYFNRPDRTSFYIGYRDIYPLQSRAVTGSITYVFSPKYSVTASTGYDFGANIQTNSLVFTRMGTDMQVSFGINYNSIINNFGVTFEIFPNIVPENKRQIGSSSGLFQR